MRLSVVNKPSWVVFLLTFILFVPLVKGGEFLSYLKKENVCAFSGFAGQILFEGQPASGAKIIREYNLTGDVKSETIIADTEGRFAFKSIFEDYREPLLSPVGFIVHQGIWTEYQGKEIQIWSAAKRAKEEYSEFDGIYRDSISCELTEEPNLKGKVVTSCHWNK